MISDGRDSSYFQDRAEAELKMARKAQGVEAVRAHKALATLYLDRLDPAKRPRSADNDR